MLKKQHVNRVADNAGSFQHLGRFRRAVYQANVICETAVLVTHGACSALD